MFKSRPGHNAVSVLFVLLHVERVSPEKIKNSPRGTEKHFSPRCQIPQPVCELCIQLACLCLSQGDEYSSVYAFMKCYASRTALTVALFTVQCGLLMQYNPDNRTNRATVVLDSSFSNLVTWDWPVTLTHASLSALFLFACFPVERIFRIYYYILFMHHLGVLIFFFVCLLVFRKIVIWI